MPSDDDDLTTMPSKPTADASLEDVPAADPAKIDPKEFDLGAWIAGIGPASTVYEMDGVPITLQARTPTWTEEWVDRMKDADKEMQDRDFLAAHIDGDVSPDQLEALQKGRPIDFVRMVNLAVELDMKPTGKIGPRLFPGASD